MGTKARFWAFMAGFGGAIAAILAFLFSPRKSPSASLDAEKIKSDMEVKIENTQAQDLVNASGRADQHHATVGRIKQELRDKINNHLQNLLSGAGD
jgi:gas vesicle protein